MASLYQIDQAILECLDAETGEIIDAEKLNALFMEKNQKIENVALWIKNLQADALAYKAEKDAFAARQKAAENKVESLKAWLAEALQGEKFSSTRCAVSWKPSEAVKCTDESIIPKKYLVKTITFRPDKAAIKNAIKSGLKVKGAELVNNLNPQIK